MIAGVVTAALLLIFIAGLVWLFVFKRKSDFDEAANLPLKDNENERSS